MYELRRVELKRFAEGSIVTVDKRRAEATEKISLDQRIFSVDWGLL